jgi:hypothetical protein
MEKALEVLSVSALRNLLIEEVRKFILCLDHSPTDELVQMKGKLRMIFDLITEKEREERTPLVWGKNSTQPAKDNPQDDPIEKIISGLQSE